jgi:alcohol dehydrogenase class IV
MDALTHAVEAYIGHSNTKQTEKDAIIATKLVFENIETAYKDGKNVEARENMLVASFHAGLAFTRAYVGYVHAIAHNLGGMYNIPHGLANAVILPYVLDYFGETAYKRLAELADVAGVSGAAQGDRDKAKNFIAAIRKLNETMGIPDKFEQIKDEDIQLIAERALMEGNPLYPVPKIMDLEDCKALIKKLQK